MSALNKALITVAAILLMMGLLKLNNNRKLKRGFQYPFLILCPVIVVAEVLALILLRNEIWQWLNQQSWASWAYSSIMQAGSDLFGIEHTGMDPVPEPGEDTLGTAEGIQKG